MSRPNGVVPSMVCQACSGQIFMLELDGVYVGYCSRCSGFWFDRRALEAFRYLDPDVAWSPAASPPGKRTGRHCPQCWGALASIPYGPGVRLTVQRCAACRGVWLASGGLAKIRHSLKRDARLGRAHADNLEAIDELEFRLHRAARSQREAEIVQVESHHPVEVEVKLDGLRWWFMVLTMLPRKVYHPVGRFPVVTVALILMNLLAFVAEVTIVARTDAASFFWTYGFVPDKIRQLENIWTVVTAMFLHGGFWHLFGNMYFLYLFGENVEEYLGSTLCGTLYFLSGVVAFWVHFAADVYPRMPAIGASGAVAGLAGAYMLLFANRRLYVLILGWGIKIRAFWYLGLWFAFQMWGAWFWTGEEPTYIAWFAHIGGFLVGLLFVALYRVVEEGKRLLSSTSKGSGVSAG